MSWSEWRRARTAAATAPYGIASLDRTEWLDETPRELSGLPGKWIVDGADIVGADESGREVRLRPGEDATVAGLRVRNFDRRGHTLRVFDPASVNRVTIEGITAYDEDPSWRLEGRFRPAEDDREVDVVAVDGLVSSAHLAGEIDFDTPAGPATLTVTRTATGGLSAVLGDATNGTETYRFRFVDLAGAVVGDDGGITVDFNRLYLPPCAFSPEYVCPTPLPGNRWDIPVRAGERAVARRG